ncbi:MAG: MFS transporter, partial [Deltaproteobacteria bacterium]|nr:MFS transporter [Deltaproteobacteria bacterium]
PAAQAYIGDITPRGKEGTVMGLFNLSVFGGLSIGPLMGGIIHDHFSMNAAFLCMGGLAFLGSMLCFFFLPRTKLEKVVTHNLESPSFRILIKDPEFTGFFVFRLAYTFCIGIIWCFLPVFAGLGFGFSSSEIGILVTVAVLVSGLLNVPMGVVADRFNKKYMVSFGGIVITWSIYSFTLADSFQDLFVANFLFGLGGGISMPALTALAVIKGNETGSMGSVMAILTMAHSMGMLLGSLVAGLAMDFIGLKHAFPIGAFLMVLGVAVFLFCCRKKL